FQALGACRLDHKVGGARAHRRHDVVDAAMRGLHDYRDVQIGLAHPRHDTASIEVRHHQVEDHAVDTRCLRTKEEIDGGIAAVRGDHLVAEALDHAFKEAALNRIVIDDQHDLGHKTPTQNCAELVQCRRSRLMPYKIV